MSDSQVIAANIQELRQRHSSKWRRFAPDVLPMHVAEMDFQIAEGIRDVIVDFTNRSDLGYLGPVPEVAESFVAFAAKRWGWVVDAKQIKLATDVGVAAVEVFRALGKPGDQVVVNTPVYSAFFGWIAETKLSQVDVPLIQNGTDWSLDLDGLEKAFAAGAKFYLLCHPHNPLGKVYSRAELTAIAALAVKYDVIVISDEIHGPLTYAGVDFTPYLACGADAEATGIVITSASKSWNLAGLKAAILVTQSAAMATKVSVLPPDMHWRTSILGAFAMAEAFSNCSDWLDAANLQNQSSRDLLTNLIAEQLPTVEYWIPEAGYLAWLDLSPLGLGANPAAKILDQQKVAFVAGVDLGAAYDQFIRINFACHPDSLRKAISAIAACV